MSAKEREGGAGGYLRDTKAPVDHGGRLCVFVYTCIEILHIPCLQTIIEYSQQFDAN